MKIVELTTGYQLPITNEESDLLSKFDSETALSRKSLTERDVVLANQLVNKDVLIRTNRDGEITYTKKQKKSSGPAQ